MSGESVDSVRNALAESAGDAARCQADEAGIREAAAARLGTVTRRIGELRPKALGDPESARDYEAMIAERGRLNLVLGGGDQAAPS